MGRQDLTGQRYGDLVVIEKTNEKHNRYSLWRCKCICGRETLINTRHLKRGTIKNCGCIPKTDARKGPVAEDLTGQDFGELKVLYQVESKNGRTRWRCQCSCGKQKDIASRELKNGKIKSCGCRQRKKGRYPSQLAGQKFGRLVALYPLDKRDKKSSIYWMCQCECGEKLAVTAARLMQGVCRSCGCLKRENQKKIYKKLHRIDGTCVEWLEKRKYRCDNTSGFRGVYTMRNGKYRAAIGFKGQRFHIGTYDTFEEAIDARKSVEALLHDGFVRAYYDWQDRAEAEPEWAKTHPFIYDVEKIGSNFVVTTNMD